MQRKKQLRKWVKERIAVSKGGATRHHKELIKTKNKILLSFENKKKKSYFYANRVSTNNSFLLRF